MALLQHVAVLIVGTVLLIGAAKYLLEGLIGIASTLAVPIFILSMLLISIDLEVFAPAIAGSYQNFTALSYGGILGTVVFLICMAMGAAATIAPLSQIQFPLRYVLILGAALVVNILWALDGMIQRWEGSISIALYVAYLGMLIVDLSKSRTDLASITAASDEVADIVQKPLWHYLLWLGGGLIALVGGGLIVVQGSRGLLTLWGVSETIIGVTVLAIAANSVELVEAIIPAQRGLGAVLVGNVVGSATFQVLFTSGFAALIRPLQVEPIALHLFLPVVMFSWGLLLAIVLRGHIVRWEGISLMVLYGVFLAISLVLGIR